MMNRLINLQGQKFGRLTCVKRSGSNRWKEAVWECLCDCGGIIHTLGSSLRKGQSRSCGCLFKEVVTIHADYKTNLYAVWANMKKRCNCVTDPSFEKYGGRGIAVCPEWAESYEMFRAWAIESGYRKGLTIDRRDNEGSYCPENCRWATYGEQNRNHRRNVWIEHNGVSLVIEDWAKKLGVHSTTLRRRLRTMSVDQAFKKTKNTKRRTP